MRFRVRPERFTLVALPRDRTHAALAAVARAAPGELAQVVLEPDAVTVLAPHGIADALAREPHARVEAGYRLVTFETPMSWDVVGFLARATGVLADAGIPLGAVCGFERDHLFLRAEFLDRARDALRSGLCPEA